MSGPESTAILLGVRTYYEELSMGMRREVGAMWPGWDDLNSEQVTAWTLAYASNVEISVRLAQAVTVMS